MFFISNAVIISQSHNRVKKHEDEEIMKVDPAIHDGLLI